MGCFIIYTMWKASEDIKFKKEVEAICKSMEKRVIELCCKIVKGNYNGATLPAFWLAAQGDIDDGLKKAKEKSKYEKRKNNQKI
jgi:hypothetical protein